jgi:hypothetical protein
MKKRIIRVFVIFAILLAITAIISVHGVNRYIDTHTWATISISGENHSDTYDAFSEEHEYMKGDHISTGDLSLLITKIRHNGDVTFKVERGSLYDGNGEKIKSDTISKNKKITYRTDNGNIQLNVISVGYE